MFIMILWHLLSYNHDGAHCVKLLGTRCGKCTFKTLLAVRVLSLRVLYFLSEVYYIGLVQNLSNLSFIPAFISKSSAEL